MPQNKDMSPLPLKAEGNGSNIIPFDLDVADLLMLESAFAIARNTEMMSQGKDSMRRLEYYRQQAEALLPEGARNIRCRGYLAETIYAIRENGWWSHCHKKRRTWDNSGETIVKSGERTWSFNFSGPIEEHEEILSVIRELAPLNAEERPWEESET